MENASMNRKITVSAIRMMSLALSVLVILLTSLFLLGCGTGEEEAEEKTEMEAQYIDKGTCTVGLTLKPGESCSYFGSIEEVVFSVRQDGFGCRDGTGDVSGVDLLKTLIEPQTFCVDYDIELDDLFGTNFAASKNPDGSWTVNRDGNLAYGGLTFVIEVGDDDTSLVLRFEEVIGFGDSSSKAYDVQWRTKTPQGSWSSACYEVPLRDARGQTVTINSTITGLEPGTTYQVRYRNTNRESCLGHAVGLTNPGPWSPIGEGTTSGGQ